MIPETPEQRKGLEKFYQKVLTCKLCKKLYGTDDEIDFGNCPRCIIKLRGRKYGTLS